MYWLQFSACKKKKISLILHVLRVYIKSTSKKKINLNQRRGITLAAGQSTVGWQLLRPLQQASGLSVSAVAGSLLGDAG